MKYVIHLDDLVDWSLEIRDWGRVKHYFNVSFFFFPLSPLVSNTSIGLRFYFCSQTFQTNHRSFCLFRKSNMSEINQNVTAKADAQLSQDDSNFAEFHDWLSSEGGEDGMSQGTSSEIIVIEDAELFTRAFEGKGSRTMMVNIDTIATLNFGRPTSIADAANLLNRIGERKEGTTVANIWEWGKRFIENENPAHAILLAPLPAELKSRPELKGKDWVLVEGAHRVMIAKKW